ncbi:hypothetical protein HWB05_gp157 [Streptomyces phage BRock]|uniref:Uncharacterized protein n=1 Tax=Streptomyces phage BRock TaxID=1913591 RepID=A0A1J0GW66_9CAUD|nr:hypothetical protein HWB05_gp157 [Streptomyces phage BRock]APC46420.1 hypothetical protein [Streptomyces phage BRock]
MIFKKREYGNADPVYTKARRRLETVTSDEVVRYMDNLHTAIGRSVQETRKNLARNSDEVPLYCNDIRDAAQALLAATDVLKLR